MTCLYDTTMDDSIKMFMHFAYYRSWLKGGCVGNRFGIVEVKDCCQVWRSNVIGKDHNICIHGHKTLTLWIVHWRAHSCLVLSNGNSICYTMLIVTHVDPTK